MTLPGHPFGHPFDRFGPANQVTAGRAVLTVAVATTALMQTSETTAWAAVGLGVLITLLDGVDGWLARRSGMASAFGARFDMEVDAFLILALSVLTWRHGKAGPWIIASGLLRYLFVAAGWCLPWMQRPLPPSRRRQTVCVVQIAALLFALLPVVPAPAAAGLAAVSLAALCYSFLVDVVWLWQSA
jgi:phosphatidylglycerophosphate synthase